MGGFKINLSQLAQMSRYMQSEPTREDKERYLRYNPTYLTTGIEAVDLLIATAILAFVLGFQPILSGRMTWGTFTVLMIIITPSFILHELAHKYTAEHFDHFARFILVKFSALLSILMGAIGILIAAPGAAVTLGQVKEDELGKIKLAGPVTNLILSIIAYVLSLVLPSVVIGVFTLPWIFQAFALVNAFLGLLNMIPIGIFDGQKVLEWSIEAWSLTILLQLPILLLTYPTVTAIL